MEKLEKRIKLCVNINISFHIYIILKIKIIYNI